MAIERDTSVEQGVLETFQAHLPSVYFSDKSEAEFARYRDRMERFYRMRLQFPPEMFAGKALLDLGAGTGENTVYLAGWGARCTLVEMNPEAHAISKGVFDRYAPGGEHEFINASLFEWEDRRTFDIVHSRGVFSHTSNKEGAFRKLASHLRAGGYLIFGDPNRAGGFQNMLQRWILYRFASDWSELQALAERFFGEDIDRSQAAVPRTREAIIYDRWVVPQQDDPSVADVLRWMRELGLELYASWPRLLQPVFGDSAHHPEVLGAEEHPGMGVISELVWMMQNEGDRAFVPRYLAGQQPIHDALEALTGYVGDVRPDTRLEPDRIGALTEGLRAATQAPARSALHDRLRAFLDEVDVVVRAMAGGEIGDVERAIHGCRHLFRGAVGVRHVDYVAYKPHG